MATMEERIKISQQQLRLSRALIQQFNFERDTDRLNFVDLHPPHVQGQSFGNNHYVRAHHNEQGRSGLYRSRQNISTTSPGPVSGQTTAQWQFIGWGLL